MIRNKLAKLATTALVGNVFFVAGAYAQSTGTAASEMRDVIIVTGSSGPLSVGGAVAQTVDKTRSTIDQELIERQNPGQTILQSLNLVPGLNFTNSDPYGNSGGNIRLRGFDGNRVGLAVDGIPLNDTGNYATFTNQQLDPELIQRASVNQGTTDVDSPTAAAIGGIINYVTATPYDEAGFTATGSVGENNYYRLFLRGDTGEFGPWGTKAFFSASQTEYDKFKGPGELKKNQYNAKVYQDLGGDDSLSVTFNYNRNRNDFYNNFVNLAQFNAGNYLENDISCTRPTPVNGTAQNESQVVTIVKSDGTTEVGTVAVPRSCTNYHGLRINPSDTGNVHASFSYGLTDTLRLTLDPSFQYVMANGGGFTLVSERDDRLDQNATNNTTLSHGLACGAANLTSGADLNGDGDTCDNVGLYTPSNTNTRRYGLLASLIWDLDDNNQFRLSYTNDYGRHRQTGEASFFDINSEPEEVFAGKEGWGNDSRRAVGRDGSFIRSRDRFSLAILNQFALDWRGEFFNDDLTISLGARAPRFKRDLTQNCFTANGTSTVLCTTQAFTTLANGNVQFAGNATQYVAPHTADYVYEDILPNASFGYRFGDSSVYGSYSEQIAVPRTDNLYTANRPATATTIQPIAFNDVDPEFSKNYELGYRYTNSSIVASAAIFLNQYSNRVVSTLDNDPASPTFNTTIDRNVGEVESQGFEGSIGWNITNNFSLYASTTYINAELQEDQLLSVFTCPATGTQPGGCTPNARLPQILPTKGKNVVETPEWMHTARLSWDVTQNFSMGLQAKYVDERFTTDVNDEVVPSYTTVDFDARYDLTDLFNIKNAYIQLNVSNITDETYPINISSGTNALLIADVDPVRTGDQNRTGLVRTFGIAAPRTAVVTLGTRF